MRRDEAKGHSAVDRVHAALREGIVSGALAPESRLRVQPIANANGVSVIPVREALRRLEVERLVVLDPNRGARVAVASTDDVRDIYETRIALECAALGRAFGAIALTDVDAALADMHRAARRGDEQALSRSHRAFHFALYRPAGSQWSMHFIEQLWVAGERYLRAAIPLRDSRQAYVGEHERLLDVIRDSDRDEAMRALEDHIRSVMRLLSKA